MVSDRDVTIRIRKRAMPAAFEVRFETANAEGPPESKGYVRIPVVRGIYTSVKQLSETLFSGSGNAFSKALLI